LSVVFVLTCLTIVSARDLSNCAREPNADPHRDGKTETRGGAWPHATHLVEHLHRQLRRDRAARDQLVQRVGQRHPDPFAIPRDFNGAVLCEEEERDVRRSAVELVVERGHVEREERADGQRPEREGGSAECGRCGCESSVVSQRGLLAGGGQRQTGDG
jgi:hypothetical protein